MSHPIWEILASAGPVVWPLLACSILLTAIVVERILSYRRTQMNVRKFMGEISEAVKRNKMAEALALCDQHESPIARMVRVGLTSYGKPREEIREAIEEAGFRETPLLEKNLTTLATLGHVAPLLGLLGTLLGLIRAFYIMHARANALLPVGPGDVAQGIWQALLTTTFGLMIAIPAVVAYNYFVRKYQRILWGMEVAAADLVRLLAGENPA
ncbi:MAG: MotA/TolQ/ExbB proton channel family protein [Candidatus Omnitrophica bacterium]|nr:MotA/TolQ/ExbB proton channel family protein [Candidatus Omnitrophota bacterium]